MAMKPVPKAILIALVVAGTAYGGMKFLPKHPQVASAPAPDTTVVAPPSADAAQAAQAPAAPPSIPDVPAQPLPQAAADTPHLNTSNGDAGLAAVLGAGKK